MKHQKDEENKKVIPHFWNLNEDPALAGMIVHFTNEGELSQYSFYHKTSFRNAQVYFWTSPKVVSYDTGLRKF